MENMMRRLSLLILAVLLGACAPATQTASVEGTPAEEFSAIFTNISNVGATGATPVTIRISRWSTDAEHQQLMAALEKDGTQEFVRLLQGMEATGSIGVPQDLAYPLMYARQRATKEGGRHIMLATDRPMSFQERVSASISRDYPVTWVEFTLDKEDEGSGIVVLAARLRLLGDILGVEDLGMQPAKLNEIRKVR